MDIAVGLDRYRYRVEYVFHVHAKEITSRPRSNYHH
jgi:hypothetical protein